MNAVAQQALQFVANMLFVRRCQLRGSFRTLDHEESQIKSPALLRDSLACGAGWGAGIYLSMTGHVTGQRPWYGLVVRETGDRGQA